MRLVLLALGVVLTLSACAEPDTEIDPDVTGTVEAGGASSDGTLDADPVEPSVGDLAPPALPEDSVHAGL